jgi:S1-C subfamily serine protease
VIDPQQSTEGLTIISILPESAAAKAGLQKGDVLYQIDDVPISDAQDAHRALAERSASPIHKIYIKRDGTQQVLIIELPDAQ